MRIDRGGNRKCCSYPNLKIINENGYLGITIIHPESNYDNSLFTNTKHCDTNSDI